MLSENDKAKWITQYSSVKQLMSASAGQSPEVQNKTSTMPLYTSAYVSQHSQSKTE